MNQTPSQTQTDSMAVDGTGDDPVDLLVIGGGINGTGIARDAAGRGLSVALVEKDDLAQGTSSRSSKLIHGGLRYLEYYEFRLVREALAEREVLLSVAPHLVRPMRFVLPHSPSDRPAWLLRLGLFLYDHLGGRKRLPGTRTLDLRRDPEGAPIVDDYARAFEYSDCWVDDARLVTLNARGAADLGARVMTRTRAVTARRDAETWTVTVEGPEGRQEIRARCLVNAGGPWVADVIRGVAGSNSSRNVQLVKGSHIITRRFWDGPQAYIVQNSDRRIVFVIPYERDLAVIGTTDVPYEGRPEDVAASGEEIDYLLAVVNRYFKEKLTPADVLTTYSGVRALADDGKGNPSAASRDYEFELDRSGGAPMLDVFGGKITTFRELSERALALLKPVFPKMGPDWTATAPLPGGDMAGADYQVFSASLRARYPWMPRELREHYGRLYGTRTEELVGDATGVEGLGRHFGGLLYAAEARYLISREWARTAEDILTRRTKHHLHMTEAEKAAFADWLADELALQPGPAQTAGRSVG